MALTGTWRNVLWSDIHNTVDSVEHPLLGSYLPKDLYLLEFGAVFDAMQGLAMDEYVDFYFERDSVHSSTLRFVGDNERLDFYDWAVELGCSSSVEETRTGEDKEAEIQRKNHEEQELRQRKQNECDACRSREIQRQKQLQKRNQESAAEKDRKILLSRYKSLANVKKPEKLVRAKTALVDGYRSYKKEYRVEIEELEKNLNLS